MPGLRLVLTAGARTTGSESMALGEAAYRLVVFDMIDEPAEVRELLCRVTGAHPTDVNQWLARLPGLWPKALSEAHVRTLLDGLYELGIAAEARTAETIPVLAPARTVHDVACLEDGFRVRGLRKEPTHWVPWEKVALVNAGYIEQEDELRTIAPPMWVTAVKNSLNAVLRRPQMIARRERAMRIPREPAREIIMVREDPRLAFRLSEHALTYAYLGPRLRPSASENFPLLLEDICQKAPDDALTPTTRAIREGAGPQGLLFATSQSLVEDAVVRLLWKWYRRDRDEELERGRDR
jgi:hypothetical protein